VQRAPRTSSEAAFYASFPNGINGRGSLWIAVQYKESGRRTEAKRIYRLIEKYDE
jgi:hypothetical protein